MAIKDWKKLKTKVSRGKSIEEWGIDMNDRVIQKIKTGSKYQVTLTQYYDEDEDGDAVYGNEFHAIPIDKKNLSLKKANELVKKIMRDDY